MIQIPPESFASPIQPATFGSGPRSGTQVATRWAALHEAATVVAALAGVVDDAPAAARSFPVAIAACGGWQLRTALQGMDDIGAVLETGINALLAVHASGGQVTAPARALWTEFASARDGLIALCPPGTLGQRHLA